MGYLLFLAGAVTGYFLLPPKGRNRWLLLCSGVFYLCQGLFPFALLVSTTVITYLVARGMGARLWGKRRLWLVLGLVLQLVPWLLLKYKDFLFPGPDLSPLARGLPVFTPQSPFFLPVGLSFFTLQALGYTVEVYRGNIEPERNFRDYALFLSFFPSLLAGPISRIQGLLPQLKAVRSFSYEDFKAGVLPILWGLMKKVVLGDTLAVLVNTCYAKPQNHSGPALLLATVAFAFQIYCDFSGYSQIARGSARLFGIVLPENFLCPYFSPSIREFWRRWHISLSIWFRDYLYIPLGGSRKGKIRCCLGILLVFAVSGMWHGATLPFLIWGLLHGVYRVLGQLFAPGANRLLSGVGLRPGHPLRAGLGVLFTFSLVSLAWVFFRADSLEDAWTILSAIGSFSQAQAFRWDALGLSIPTLWMLLCGVVVLLAGEALALYTPVVAWLNRVVVVRYCVYFCLIVVILLFGAYGTGYVPQNFVYFQF